MCGSLKSSCLVTLDNCPRTSEVSHVTSDSSLVTLHFFFFFFFFWELCFKRGITYLLAAHVKRINVRKKQCLLSLYFKASYFWHPSLRMVLSQCGDQEVNCVGWSILWVYARLGLQTSPLSSGTCLLFAQDQHRLFQKFTAKNPGGFPMFPPCL